MMLSLAATVVALPLLASAHMSPWLPSMYGVGPNFAYCELPLFLPVSSWLVLSARRAASDRGTALHSCRASRNSRIPRYPCAAAGDPVVPIGPGQTSFDDWWFRGPDSRSLKPQSNVASQLPAGGSFTMEIACHVAWVRLFPPNRLSSFVSRHLREKSPSNARVIKQGELSIGGKC